MMLGEHYLEDISTIKGQIKAAPIAVEPVSDIAVLGPLDGSETPKEMQKYLQFSEEICPIRLCLKNYEPYESFPVHVYTHMGKWVSGEATLNFKDGEKLWIVFNEQIEGGTSGSPIINDAGELVGIVSNVSINPGQTKSEGWYQNVYSVVALASGVIIHILHYLYGYAIKSWRVN
jgi:hypothetical protein